MGIPQKTVQLLVRGHGPKIGHTVGETDEWKEVVCKYDVIIYLKKHLKFQLLLHREALHSVALT